VLEVLREPMFSLLIGGGVIYLLLGDIKEALILLAFALLSIAITVVQETRTEHVLEALRNLASPGRWSFATVCASGSPDAKWCGGMRSFLPKVTAFRPTHCCSKRLICRPTNPC
jgi:hypothetical protein